jgi:hypothetical protein
MSAMKHSLLRAFLCVASALPAFAEGQRPGSLLVFPLVDNSRGDETWLTVTNLATGPSTSTVAVEFIYVRGSDCLEFNRTRILTPKDTITVRTKNDNPQMAAGYCYAFAKDPASGLPITHDFLIGREVVLIGATIQTVEIPAIPFVGRATPGQGTDRNGNGRRDFDNLEYEAVPEELHVPNFIGQLPTGLPLLSRNDLVLVNLTGGAAFTAVVDFRIYNDNEEAFSAQTSFSCWTRRQLLDISGVFGQAFLFSTNNNPLEGWPQAIGAPLPDMETGWYTIDGNVAFSSADSEQDPALLAVQIERNFFGWNAGLPWATGTQTNGTLVLLGNQFP